MIQGQNLSLDDVDSEKTYEECHFTYSSDQLSFSAVAFKNCTFEQTDFSHSEWVECEFKSCQFLNNNFSESCFFQTVFNKYQLMGTNFSNNTWKNVTVKDSKADYCNFSSSKIDASSFVDTSLLEAYFQETKIKKKLLCHNCEMNGVDFLDTSLRGLDLSTSYFDDLIVTPSLVKECIIAPLQATAFAGLLGVKFKE